MTSFFDFGSSFGRLVCALFLLAETASSFLNFVLSENDSCTLLFLEFLVLVAM